MGQWGCQAICSLCLCPSKGGHVTPLSLRVPCAPSVVPGWARPLLLWFRSHERPSEATALGPGAAPRTLRAVQGDPPPCDP